MKRLLLTLVALLTLIPFSSYADGRLRAVASFSIIGDMVKQVAGDNIDLKVLVGSNGDVHEYEPTPADAKLLANADIVFINGLGLEGWMERLISSSNYKGSVIVVTKGVTTLKSGMHDDPHAWQDIANARIYVQNIRDALVKADKAHVPEYKSNAAAYIKKLDALDAWAIKEISQITPDRRKVISQHDSFQYFTARYGVKFIAPMGISTESQASAADMARIIDQIRAQHITAIFLENMSDAHIIKQLESDTGIRVGGTLYSDALSEPNGPAPDYIAMFRHNIMAIVAALQPNLKR